MATTAQIQANLKIASNLAKSRIGYDGELDAMSYEQEIAYNKALAAIITQYPARFNPEAVRTASGVVSKAYEPLQSQSLADSVKIFADEIGRQVVELNNKFNPLSEDNRNATKWIVGGLLLVGVAVYFGPALLAGSKTLKARFR